MDDQEAIELMFRQFLPEDEPILFARYLGRLGFWVFGTDSMACLTSRRVATLRVAGFGEIVYQEGRLEDINSAVLYQPSKLELYLNVIFATVSTLGIALLFLPLINRIYYAIRKCGLVFCVAEGVSIYLFCNRKLIRRANELMRRSGALREQREYRISSSAASLNSTPAKGGPLTDNTPGISPSSPQRTISATTRLAPSFTEFSYGRKPGRKLVRTFQVLLGVYSTALLTLMGGLARYEYIWRFIDTVSEPEWNQIRDLEYFNAITAATGAASLLAMGIIALVWLGKAWAALPARYQTCSAATAVTPMLIPIFNFFWVYRAIPGLARSLDWAHRDLLQAPKPVAGRGAAIATAVLLDIPLVGTIFLPFAFIRFMSRANSVLDKLIRHQNLQLEAAGSNTETEDQLT
jgi:hypothetical protein